MRHPIATIVVLSACLPPCSEIRRLPASETEGASFPGWLAAAGIDRDSLAAVPALGPLAPGAETIVRRVLYRLNRLALPANTRTGTGTDWRELLHDRDAQRGEVVHLRGRVVHVERVQSHNFAEDESPMFLCRMQLDASSASAAVWTHELPSAWSGHHVLDERSAAEGVLAGIDDDSSGRATLIVLAPRVAWHPDETGRVQASVGRRLLGDLGVDVGLLDEVQHDLPLTQGDHVPFYSLLSAVEQCDAGQLLRTARASLESFAAPWRDQPRVEADRHPDRQRELLAAAVTNAAAKGRYSVAPLFLDAKQQTGNLLMLDGIARRAIRIEVSDSVRNAIAGSGVNGGLDHYFELEVFTPDSQNLPVVCAVPSLPPDFPIGDAIRERVRVAGFFFKKWRYDSRLPLDAGQGPLRFQLTSSPLIIAAEPQWPLAEGIPSDAAIEWIAGGAFVLVVVVIILAVWRWSRGDRACRRRMAAAAPRGQVGPPADS